MPVYAPDGLVAVWHRSDGVPSVDAVCTSREEAEKEKARLEAEVAAYAAGRSFLPSSIPTYRIDELTYVLHEAFEAGRRFTPEERW